MSDSISKNLSLLFIPKKDEENGNTNELSATNSTRPNSLPSYKRISSELWLLIFSNLERNDLDSCENVCVWWHEIIRHNGKYLPGREIDYIMFSSKRAFSMVLSSGNLVKMYRFDKYFTLRGTLLPVDHPSFMTVRTYRRSRIGCKPPPGSNQLRLFIDELRMLTNGVGDGGSSSSNGRNEEGTNGGDQIGKFGGVDAIGLHYPHFVKKTPYKIMTPPSSFFVKLNRLLRNLDHINFIVFQVEKGPIKMSYYDIKDLPPFQTFSLTDAFVERFIHFIEPKIVANDVRLIRFKLGKTHHRAIRFFFGAILGNKHVLDRLPSTGLTTMINWEY